MPFQKGHAGGPGRPRKADKNAGAVAKAEKQIRDRLPELVENMMALADGVFVEELTVDGLRIVFKRPPDRQANEYLINRVMGKPTERQELDLSGDLSVKGYALVSPDDWDDKTDDASTEG